MDQAPFIQVWQWNIFGFVTITHPIDKCVCTKQNVPTHVAAAARSRTDLTHES